MLSVQASPSLHNPEAVCSEAAVLRRKLGLRRLDSGVARKEQASLLLSQIMRKRPGISVGHSCTTLAKDSETLQSVRILNVLRTLVFFNVDDLVPKALDAV